ncbi:MAG: WG repeat-containing protein, partial [Oscillospiraceae bacterium]
KYTTAWNGISAEKKLIIFISNDKQGLMDFDDNVLVEPKYFEIYGLKNPLLTVRVGEKGNYKEGLISTDGKVVLPAIYKRISWCSNNRIICCADGYCEFMQII